MFPSLRFMFAAVLSTLVILVIASSALISTRRPEAMVLQPVGSRPLAAHWASDDAQSFEARFGPQAMLINASVQLPPKDPTPDRGRSARIEFVATANATADPTKSVDPAKHSDKVMPADIAAAPPAPVPAPAEEPLTMTPGAAVAPLAVSPAEISPVQISPAQTSPAQTSPANVKIDPPIVVAAVDPVPVPAKDPQIASDAPAQSGRRTAAILPAAPAVEGPAFSDTSRIEQIAKPAVKRRAQIKRPKRRVARVFRPAPVVARPSPQTPTNPFAALFGSSNTP